MEQALFTVKRAGDKSLPLDTRRQAYSELISLSKSDSADVKKLVGISIPLCFETFTSLQEDAVDAVYDLCEDVDMDVRIVGYKTFERISRNVTAWVKRNTDVLIQLLQVETPEELTCIRDLLLKHIRISAPPALAVIVDNLCSSESDDKKKETLLDILEVEGRTWIKKECMNPTSTGEENEDGKLLREGLEQVLRSSPPPHLRLKIYRLLAPLPHTSSSLPTSILLLQPPSKETYLLALSCARPPDSRSVVLNWYEGGSGIKEGGEVEELRELCRSVRKWWEDEKDGRGRGRGGGVVGEGPEWEEKDVRERWRKVEDGLVSMLAVRVVTYWKQAKPSSGMTSRPIPFPLMESLLMTLAYLSEIPYVQKSQITVTSLEFCRHLFDQPTESPWKSAIGAIKKLHDNYGELLAWFRASRQSSGSKPHIPRLTPSWEFAPSSSSSNHRDLNFKESRRTSLITAETTFIDPPPRAQPSSLSIPRNTTNGSLASRLSGNGVAAGRSGGGAEVKPMVGGEDRKRKFAVASGGASEFEKPGKRIATPQSAPQNGRRTSSSPTSDMDGIVALPGRPSNFPSSSTPSLLNRISDSSTTNGHTSRASPITLSSSSNSSFSSGNNNNGSSSSNSRLHQPRRASPPSTSNSFIPGPPPHLQPTPIPIPVSNPPPRTSTFNIVIPNSEIRHQPPHLARQLSSSNSLSAFTASRQPPPPPPLHSPLPPPAPIAPPVAAAAATALSFLPTGPRSDYRPGAFDQHYHSKKPQPSYHHQLHGTPNHPQGPAGLSHLPFHPDYRGPPPPPSQAPLQPPPRIIKQGPDLISSFGSPAPSSTREEEEANPNKGLNVRGRAKARAPPAFVPEPEPEEEVWGEDQGQEEEGYEDEGWGGGAEEMKQTTTTTTTGRGLLGRMS